MKSPIVAAVCCALLLALAAFWPSTTRDAPQRPSIRGPIVFDELQRTTSELEPAGHRTPP